MRVLATLRFYDAAIYNATGSKFVATEHARAFLLKVRLHAAICRADTDELLRDSR